MTSGMVYFAITPSSYLRVVLHEVREARKGNNPYDMIILGQSRGETNINPYVLDEHLDYNSYNLSRRILRMSDLYYMLSEVNENKTARAVVLDVDHVYWTDPQISYYSDAYLLPHLSNPVNKVDYFFRYTLSADYRVMFSRYSVHGIDDIKKIGERLRTKLSPDYYNYSMSAVSDKDADHVYVGRGYNKGIAINNKGYGADWDIDIIDDSIVSNVERLVKYCKENDIQIVAIHAPVPHGRFTDASHKELNYYFKSTFAGMGVDFINFNYISPEYLEWNDEDFSDGEGHMMGEFADEYSALLGEILDKYFNSADISLYFAEEVNL